MSTLSRRLNFRYLVLALAVCFLAAGCAIPSVPVGKFDDLAKSCQKIIKGTTETYTRIMKMERRYFAETALFPYSKKKGKKIKKIEDAFSAVNFLFPEATLTKNLYFREAALKGLLVYLLALKMLASYDFSGNVNQVIDKLKGNMNSLIDALPFAKLQDNKDLLKFSSGILAKLINRIALYYVNIQRIEFLKKTMDEAQSGILKLTGLLAGDRKGLNVYIQCRQNSKDQQSLLDECNSAYIHNKHNILIVDQVRNMLRGILSNRNRKGTEPVKDAVKRIAFYMEVAVIFDEGREIQEALKILSKAIKLVACAHEEIRKSFDAKPPESNEKPQNLNKKAAQQKPTCMQLLVQEVGAIDNFYRSLK